MSNKSNPVSTAASAHSAGKSENMEEHGSHAHGSSHPNNRRPRKMSEMSQGPGLLEMVAGDEPDDGEQEKLFARSSSIIKFYPEWCRCCPRTSEPVPENATYLEQCRDFFQCPPKGTFGRILLVTLICLSTWGLLFFLFMPLSKHNEEGEPMIESNPAWFHGPLFALGIIEITGLISGILLKKFLNLPPLLGPLVLGIIGCRYNDTICKKLAEQSVNNWVKPIRIIALGIILTRAGLELSPKQLRKLKGVVPLLAFAPCIVEALTCGIFSYIFFNLMVDDNKTKMSLAMCFVGGFALAAVSPAVVVPGALSLKKAGYGVVKGVPTLLIAASSIDDVLAISVYTIALGFAIKPENSDNDWQKYCAGAIGIGVGIVHGVICGIVLHFLPSRNSKYKAENRLLLLLLTNILSVMAYEETFFNGAGSISVLVTSLVAGFGWRSQPHWKRPMHKIEKMLAHMWVLWVPLIFGTIGKEIDFKSTAFQIQYVFKIFGVIAISLLLRCLTAFVAAGCGTGYDAKEKFFISLSWIPKATVQAALAPLVLTRAEESNDSNAKYNAEIVVTIAILAVLITAPVGCVLIALTGPKLLQQNSSPEIIMQVEEEFPNGEGIDPAESTFEVVADAKRSILRNSQDRDMKLQVSLDEIEVHGTSTDLSQTVHKS